MGHDDKSLPQLGNKMFLTDGGLETTLIFLEGLELPEFAAFVLLKDPAGREALRRYYESYASLASRFDAGMVLETPTWRSSSDWGPMLGYSPKELEAANQDAVRLMNEVRSEHKDDIDDVVVSGCIGPRGDGYQPDSNSFSVSSTILTRRRSWRPSTRWRPPLASTLTRTPRQNLLPSTV